jgi:hypothetical protein
MVGPHFDPRYVIGNEPLIDGRVRGFEVVADRLKDESFDLGCRYPPDISGSIRPSVEECRRDIIPIPDATLVFGARCHPVAAVVEDPADQVSFISRCNVFVAIPSRRNVSDIGASWFARRQTYPALSCNSPLATIAATKFVLNIRRRLARNCSC